MGLNQFDMQGWIKLHRELIEWEWYNDINTRVTFIHLLLVSNHKDNNWRGQLIKRGQRWTSINSLAKEVCLSEKQIRNALKKLKKTGEIEIKGASKGTMITICKYEHYQQDEKQKGEQSGEQRANKGRAKGEQRATNKNDKNGNNVNNENNITTNKTIDFDIFWNLYDKKTDRKKAKAKWGHLSNKDKEAIIEVVPKYVKSTPDVQFRKHASTYLNGRCWEDEIIIFNNTQRNGLTTTKETRTEAAERKLLEDFANLGNGN